MKQESRIGRRRGGSNNSIFTVLCRLHELCVRHGFRGVDLSRWPKKNFKEERR